MKWSICLLSLLSFTAAADNLVLGDAAMRLELTPAGQIFALTDLVSGEELVAPPAADAPAWRIARPNQEPLTDAAYPAPAVNTDGKGRAAVYTWSGEGLPTVTGHFNFDPGIGAFRVRADIANLTGAMLDGIALPAELRFPAADGNYLVVVADDKFLTLAKPLAELKDFTVMYPGFMYMQLAGFKLGKSALATYTDDAGAHIKWHHFTNKDGAVGHRVDRMFFLEPGAKWRDPYSLVLQVLPGGDYNDMARVYGDWARKQYWAESSLADKQAARPLLGKLFTDGVSRVGYPPIAWGTESYRQDEEGRYHYIPGTKYARYEPYYDNILDTIAAIEKAYGIAPGYWPSVWNGAYFDTPFPDYFPVLPEMGDFDEFKSRAIEAGYPMLYHMNIAHWPVTSPSAADPAYYATWRGRDYRQRWSNVEHVVTNLGKSLEVEMRTIERLADDAGVNGVYLDVVGHSFAEDDNPANPFHGTPNAYQLAKINAFRTIRAAITGPIMTEGRNEIYLPWVDLCYGACGSTAVEDQIPMWELVYGDIVATSPFTNMGNHRNMSLSMGGVINPRWEWPEVSGKDLGIFTETMQQRVAAAVIGERMERFDRPGLFRVSQWPSGVFIWNRAKAADAPAGPAKPDANPPADLAIATALGRAAVKQMAADGAVFLTSSGDFSAEKVAEVTLDGQIVFAADAPLLWVRAGERVMIRNFSDTAVDAEIRVAPRFGGGAALSGRWVKAETTLELQPETVDGLAVYRLTLAPDDCMVNW